MSNLYETDFYSWAIEQSKKLLSVDLPEIDEQNLSDELILLANKKRLELINSLRNLFSQILRWDYQPDRRTIYCIDIINRRRRDVQEILDKNCSLKKRIKEFSNEAYTDAKYDAANATGLKLWEFPISIEFSFEDAMIREIKL